MCWAGCPTFCFIMSFSKVLSARINLGHALGFASHLMKMLEMSGSRSIILLGRNEWIQIINRYLLSVYTVDSTVCIVNIDCFVIIVGVTNSTFIDPAVFPVLYGTCFRAARCCRNRKSLYWHCAPWHPKGT